MTDANNVRLYEIVSWPTLLPRDTDDVRSISAGTARSCRVVVTRATLLPRS